MTPMFPNGVPIPQPKPARPEQTSTPTAATPQEGGDLKSGWQTFLSDPANRAGLLQFGLSMLAGDPENTLAQNVGQSLGAGFAARGAAKEREYELDQAAQKSARQDLLDESLVTLRRAQTKKALRPPQGKSGSTTSGQPTQKDYAREWIKFVKDARKNEDERTIAELRTEFDEMWGAATTAPQSGAPASTGTQAAAINQMTLDQLKALDVKKMTPDELKAASARYKALGGS